MLIIKYGCTLTSDNKAGTDLDVAVFSDTVGGTTLAPVVEGDYVLEAFVEEGSAIVQGKLWRVHDGSAWEDLTPESDTAPIMPGDMMIASAPDVPYQQGSLIVFLEQNTFITANIGIMLALTGA